MTIKNRILIIDDDENFLAITKKILVYNDFEVDVCADPCEVLVRKDLDKYNLIISDLIMPQIDGIELLKHILKEFPESKTMILTGNATIDTAVEAIKIGAVTYIEKPLVSKQLVKKVKEVLFNDNGERPDFLTKEMDDLFIGGSEKIIKINETIGKISKVDSGVLIVGDSGTGKEVIANLVHRNSARKDGPIIKINCAAIPETLIESELFGFEKGAFSGAVQSKKGKITLAHKGTLFLDEVGDLSLLAQTKILRAIQEKEITTVGGETPQKVDFRLICATNKNLKQMVEKKEFREDFYYRINVINIHIPPLRQRKEDIPLFIDYFSRMFSTLFNKTIQPMTDDIMDVFIHYEWPGNIRELKNVIERIYIFVENNAQVLLADLPSELLNEKSGTESAYQSTKTTGSFKDAKYSFEKNYLTAMLKKNNWNITNTAKDIGLSRRNLHEKINQFNLKNEE